MKLIRTEEAVGHVLCHDLTQIIRGEYKDARFRKGHVVRPEDIPVLLSMGKENLYVWEMTPGMVHENDAAERLCKLCRGANMDRGGVKEGKIELTAAVDGLFWLDREKLMAINSLEDIMIATRHGDTAVKAGDKLCGTRVIPLVIEEEKLRSAEAAAGDTPIMAVLPYKVKTAGVVTTGSEVFKGLIKDTFTPVVEEKLRAYGIAVTAHEAVGDGLENVAAAIARVRAQGVDLLLHRRHERRPRRQHPRGHQAQRGPDRCLRRAGAAGGHVPPGLLRGRHPHHGPARLRDVRRGHHLRPGAAPGGRRGGGAPGGHRPAGGGGTVPGLPALHLPPLRLWQVKTTNTQ